MHIISGELKGRKLQLSAKQIGNAELRPTTNYSKQVLFNLLNNNKTVAFDFADKTILDAFCGTGSVGFELFSRGAKHVTFMDANKIHTNQIIKNSVQYGVPFKTYTGYLPQMELEDKFDLIFADPPYDEGAGKIARVISNFLNQNLNEGGLIALEVQNGRTFLEKFEKSLLKYEISERMILNWTCSSRTKFLFFR